MSSWNAALPADNSQINQSAGYLRNNEGAMQAVLTATNLTGNTPYIPNNFPMYFYESSAPSGWFPYSVLTDCLLALKASSGDYTIAGSGVVKGTWDGPGYVLQLTDLPTQAVGARAGPGGPITPFAATPSPGNAHSHNWTGTRPSAAVGILATKNS